MCTNTALVNGLECYMEDLIDSFEDFVKKSLILITLGLGAIVCTLLYVIKLVTDRTHLLQSQSLNQNAADSVQNRDVPGLEQNDKQTSCDPCDQNSPKCKLFVMPSQNTTTKNSNPILLSRSNIDETVIRDIGFSGSSKTLNRCKSAGGVGHCSITKMRNSISPICIPKHHISAPRSCAKYILSKTSCCSMCCDDDDRR